MKNKVYALFMMLSLSLLLTRLLPHPPNFTATQTAILGVAILAPRFWAFISLVATYWFADLFLNNILYPDASGFTFITSGFPWLVLGLFIQFALNAKWFSNNFRPALVLPAVLFNSTFFFLFSNFLVWVGNPRFTQEISGLIQCYIDGIPYYGNDLASNLCYTSLFFGLYWLFQTHPIKRLVSE